MKQKGFTLIELLVVIAIIGLLSSLAMVSLSSARNKAYDAQIKSDHAQMRTSLVMWADDNGGLYTGWTTPTQFVAPACSSGGYQTSIAADGSAYVIYADLCAADGYFCMDSTGIATSTAAAPTGTSCN